MAGAEPIQSQEPGTYSRSPMQVQGPKALGNPQLLSKAISRELDGSGAVRIRTGAHMGSWRIQDEDFSC